MTKVAIELLGQLKKERPRWTKIQETPLGTAGIRLLLPIAGAV